MVYHFVLTYSNWEQCTVCFSESFESLAEGFAERPVGAWAVFPPSIARIGSVRRSNNLAKDADEKKEPAFTRVTRRCWLTTA